MMLFLVFQIMDRYVDPLVAHLRRMLGYRKFRKGTRIEVDDLLRAEKIANPTRTVYCFGVSHERPGTFILSYIRNTNPHHECIGLYPKGFRFRNKDFYNIDRLVHHFQENINKPPLDERPSLPTFAAVVPLKSNTWAASDGCGYTGISLYKYYWLLYACLLLNTIFRSIGDQHHEFYFSS